MTSLKNDPMGQRKIGFTDLYCFSNKTVAGLIGTGQLRAAGKTMWRIFWRNTATPVSPSLSSAANHGPGPWLTV